MLHGRNNENVLHKKEHFSHGKKNLLFLPCNMAAVQNLYTGGRMQVRPVQRLASYSRLFV